MCGQNSFTSDCDLVADCVILILIGLSHREINQILVRVLAVGGLRPKFFFYHIAK